MKKDLVMIASVLALTLSAATNAGAQWVQTNTGNLKQISCTFVNIGSELFVGADNPSGGEIGFLHSGDFGETWSTGGVPNTFIQTLLSVGSTLYAGTYGVYLSTDNGTTWTKRTGIGLPSGPKSIIGSLLESSGKLFASCGLGLLVSTDSGSNWTISNPSFTDTMVDALFQVGANLFVGTNDSGVFLSTDNGATWHTENNGITEYGNGLGPFALIGSNLFVESFGAGVFRSTNNGANWTPAGLKDAYISQFAVSGTIIFAGTQNYPTGTNCGVYLSTDNGVSWTSVNAGLTDTFVQALTISGPNLIAGTNSNGVWYRPLSQMIASSGIAPNPSLQSSLTAFPNPLTQSTTITFTSPESGAAEIRVVNLLGASVARIYSGELSAGEHSFVWDASTMPPGTYWCEIRMNGATDRIPIVIQR